MSDFDYDASDVAACLRKLTIEKYSETLIDIDDPEPPYFFYFFSDFLFFYKRKPFLILLKN